MTSDQIDGPSLQEQVIHALAQVALVQSEAAEPPYGDDMTSSFQVGGQWFTMRFEKLRNMRHDCARFGYGPRPTNLELLKCALWRLEDFVRVGNFIYIL